MDLLQRIDWVMQQRGTNPNRWSEDAGLTRTHVRTMRSKLEKGRDPNPTRQTMESLARAANVSIAWLLTGHGAWEPYEGEGAAVQAQPSEPESPTPPPISDTITTLDATQDLINAAYNPERHKPSDVIPVEEALRVGAPLRRTDQDPVEHVRLLLDTAAKYREKGERVAGADLPALAMGHLSRQLGASQAAQARLQEELEQARQWLLANGFELPLDDPNAPPSAPPSAPPPLPSLAAVGGAKPRHPKTRKPGK